MSVSEASVYSLYMCVCVCACARVHATCMCVYVCSSRSWASSWTMLRMGEERAAHMPAYARVCIIHPSICACLPYTCGLLSACALCMLYAYTCKHMHYVSAYARVCIIPASMCANTAKKGKNKIHALHISVKKNILSACMHYTYPRVCKHMHYACGLHIYVQAHASHITACA